MTDANIPGADWPGINIMRTPPPSWPPLYYFGANNPPHPDLLRNANAFRTAGMGTGTAYVYDQRRPMLAALDYQWAGTYKKKLWDPLLSARGYPAAPVLSQARQGMFWRAQPVHNELGYQMVLLRDDGVPVGGEPASTPNYVFAGPIQAGYMGFIRPIMRAEQMPSVPPSDLQIPREQAQAMTGPYGGGPYARRPLQPPGYATVENGIQGAWPTYQYRPVAPMMLPPPQGSTPEMANTNPGFPRKKELMQNWVSPNQVARATITNPCLNPMPGSGPGYHGYVSGRSNGMGAGAGPSYATMSMRNPNPGCPMLPNPGCIGWNPQIPWQDTRAPWCGPNMRTPTAGIGVSPNQVARASIRAGNPGFCPPNPAPDTGDFDIVIYNDCSTFTGDDGEVECCRIDGGAWVCGAPGVPQSRQWFASLEQARRQLGLRPTPPRRPLGVTRPWTGMRKRDEFARAANPEACCKSCALGHECEGSPKRAPNPAPVRSFLSKLAGGLGLTAPGSGPMPALQPGECAGYSGQGGQSVTCCKGKFFTNISCFTIDYPGGRRRKTVW